VPFGGPGGRRAEQAYRRRSAISDRDVNRAKEKTVNGGDGSRSVVSKQGFRLQEENKVLEPKGFVTFFAARPT
jgi:hypothetical protein